MINIDKEILEIQMLQNNLLKELNSYNKYLKNLPDCEFPFWDANKHKASFNRLRLELNNRYIDLSKRFREHR